MRFVVFAMVGCTPDTLADPPPLDTPPAPDPIALRTLTYTAGPNWQLELPPEEQDLSDHFAYAAGLFDDGALIAYGPFLDDGRGFYVFADSAPTIDEIVEADPGAQSGVLALDESDTWSLVLDQLDAPADAVFVLEYFFGAGWPEGSTLQTVDLSDHEAYVGGLFAEGVLLAGGIVSGERGRYVVGAVDEVAARALVDADPAVIDDRFAPEVEPWAPLARQSADLQR